MAVPIEYIWQYNPVTGRVGGANQNYGERINILHSNRYMFNRMQEVQRNRNKQVTEKGLRSLAGGSFIHFVPASFDTSDEVDNELLYGGSARGVDGTAPTLSNTQVQDKLDVSRLENLAQIAAEAAAKPQVLPYLTTEKFIRKFPPVVYENPFSGSNFAYEFNPLYHPAGNEFSRSTDITGGAVSLTGYHPKLQGGAVTLAGQNPVLE